MDMDFDSASNLTVGSMFRATPRDEFMVEELLSGVLTMNPHPPQQIEAVVDWEADPIGDRNWRAQLNMLRWLDPLRREGERGNEDAAHRWMDVTQQWFSRNLDPANSVESAWMDMVDGIRARSIIAGLNLVRSTAPEVLPAYSRALKIHGAWLADEANAGHSNHLLHQLTALSVIARVLKHPQWEASARSRTAHLFQNQFDDEGINAEGAVGYHLNNYRWWRESLGIVFDDDSSSSEMLNLLNETGLELAYASQPDGYLVPIGNTGLVKLSGISHPASEFIATSGSKGEPPEELIKVYKSGYIYGRSGWGEQERPPVEETFFSLMFGRNDRVHGHIDSGSITFFANGKPWIVDPGKYSYDAGYVRRHFNQRSSHNVITVDGHIYDKTVPVELVSSEATREYAQFELLDEGYPGIKIRRRVVYSMEGEFIIVMDTVHAEEEVTFSQRWQCSPEVDVSISGNRALLRNGTRSAMLATFGTPAIVTSVEGQEKPLAGWVANGWKVRTPAAQVSITKTGSRVRSTTVLAAGYKDGEVQIDRARDLPRGMLGFDVSTGRVDQRLILDGDNVLVRPKGWVPLESSDQASANVFRSGDKSIRKPLLEAVRAAKAEAWGATSEADRASIGAALKAEVEFFGAGNDAAYLATNVLADITSAKAGTIHTSIPGGHRSGIVRWPSAEVGSLRFRDFELASFRGSPDVLPWPKEPSLYTFDLGDFVLPVAVAPDPGAIMTVLFHGAIDRSRFDLPFFQRFRFQRTLEQGPTVSISDGTLDLSSNLRLAWYLGSAEIELPEVIAGVVRKLAEASGVDRVVLQGNSGGGFAALATSAFLPSADVVAFDPQTVLRKYSRRFYEAAIEAATGVPAEAAVPILGEKRLDITRRFEPLESLPRVFGVSNTGDQIHREQHMAPLRKIYEERDSDKFEQIDMNLGSGHNSPSNDQYRELMMQVYNS